MGSSDFKVIALTGGIGSGKSTVSSYLAGKGYALIDADKIAREVVETGKPALAGLVSAFGGGILNPDGSLNRKKLGNLVFADRKLCRQMNDIMHGEILKTIKERIEKFADSGYNDMVVLDVPLYYESAGEELAALVSQVWVVDADRETKIGRVMERDNVSRREVLKIMDNQMDGEEKRRRADVVIDNSGTKRELYRTLDGLLKG